MTSRTAAQEPKLRGYWGRLGQKLAEFTASEAACKADCKDLGAESPPGASSEPAALCIGCVSNEITTVAGNGSVLIPTTQWRLDNDQLAYSNRLAGSATTAPHFC